jgi:hypothetical protein
MEFDALDQMCQVSASRLSTFNYDWISRPWLVTHYRAICLDLEARYKLMSTWHIATVNEKHSIGGAPAENGVERRNGRAGALRIEFIERSQDESLGIEWVLAAD